MWGKETQAGKVDLPDDEPEIVKLLVQYLYESEYEPVLPPAAEQTTMVAVPTPIKRGKLSSKKKNKSIISLSLIPVIVEATIVTVLVFVRTITVVPTASIHAEDPPVKSAPYLHSPGLRHNS
jgi:hypothetical protein